MAHHSEWPLHPPASSGHRTTLTVTAAPCSVAGFTRWSIAAWRGRSSPLTSSPSVVSATPARSCQWVSSAASSTPRCWPPTPSSLTSCTTATSGSAEQPGQRAPWSQPPVLPPTAPSAHLLARACPLDPREKPRACMPASGCGGTLVATLASVTAAWPTRRRLPQAPEQAGHRAHDEGAREGAHLPVGREAVRRGHRRGGRERCPAGRLDCCGWRAPRCLP